MIPGEISILLDFTTQINKVMQYFQLKDKETSDFISLKKYLHNGVHDAISACSAIKAAAAEVSNILPPMLLVLNELIESAQEYNEAAHAGERKLLRIKKEIEEISIDE